MKNEKAGLFVATNRKYLPTSKIPMIIASLEEASESKILALSGVEFKDPTTILIVSFLLGGFGIDRIMIGQVGLGVLKLITFGGFLLWWLIDLFLITGATKEYNFKQLAPML